MLLRGCRRHTSCWVLDVEIVEVRAAVGDSCTKEESFPHIKLY